VMAIAQILYNPTAGLVLFVFQNGALVKLFPIYHLSKVL